MRKQILHHFAAWVTGSLVGALAYLTKNNEQIPGDLWSHIAVAAKLRPAEHQFPLLWENAVSLAVNFFSLGSTIEYLKALGPVSLGLLTVLTYYFFAALLPDQLKPSAIKKRAYKALIAVILAVCTISFVCSEPVWIMGRIFSPAMMLTLITLSTFIFVARSISKLTYFPIVITGIFSGILASDTILGFIPPIFTSVYLKFKSWEDICEKEEPIGNPIVIAVATRRMWLCFVLFWLSTSIVNFYFFREARSAENELFIISSARYALNYFIILRTHLSTFSIMVLSAFVLVPLVIALARMNKLCSSQTLLPLGYGLFFAASGVFALLQATPIAETHFWKWSDGEFTSEFLTSIALLANSITLLISLCIFAYDIYFRNHPEVLRELYPQAMEDFDPSLMRILRSYKTILKPLRITFPLILIAYPLIVIPFRFDDTLQEISSVINSIAKTTADECFGTDVVFTDGSYDAAVETYAALANHRLKALSMMSKASAYDIQLRTRWETNELRRSLLKEGSAAALRSWYQNDDPSITNIALQVGAEIWKHGGKPMPKALGLVMRSAPFSHDKAVKAAQNARSIGEKILKLRQKINDKHISCHKLEELLSFGQWRVSRMCRMRANELEAIGETLIAEQENDLAEKLEESNPQWRKVQENIDWIRKQNAIRLTEQEGLKLGLERADFRLASTYAKRILESSSEDLKANFAMGMYFIIEKKYPKAEAHLKKCLLKAPNEPAILNNLAIVQLRQGHYHEAETNALKALKFYPNSAEIKTTLRHIQSHLKSTPVSR